MLWFKSFGSNCNCYYDFSLQPEDLLLALKMVHLAPVILVPSTASYCFAASGIVQIIRSESPKAYSKLSPGRKIISRRLGSGAFAFLATAEGGQPVPSGFVIAANSFWARRCTH
jgi:hypothetical protein